VSGEPGGKKKGRHAAIRPVSFRRKNGPKGKGTTKGKNESTSDVGGKKKRATSPRAKGRSYPESGGGDEEKQGFEKEDRSKCGLVRKR